MTNDKPTYFQYLSTLAPSWAPFWISSGDLYLREAREDGEYWYSADGHRDINLSPTKVVRVRDDLFISWGAIPNLFSPRYGESTPSTGVLVLPAQQEVRAERSALDSLFVKRTEDRGYSGTVTSPLQIWKTVTRDVWEPRVAKTSDVAISELTEDGHRMLALDGTVRVTKDPENVWKRLSNNLWARRTGLDPLPDGMTCYDVITTGLVYLECGPTRADAWIDMSYAAPYLPLSEYLPPNLRLLDTVDTWEAVRLDQVLGYMGCFRTSTAAYMDRFINTDGAPVQWLAESQEVYCCGNEVFLLVDEDQVELRKRASWDMPARLDEKRLKILRKDLEAAHAAGKALAVAHTDGVIHVELPSTEGAREFCRRFAPLPSNIRITKN